MSFKELFDFKNMDKNRKIITISVMAAIAIAIIVVIVALVTGGNEENNDKEQPTKTATATKAPVETNGPEETVTPESTPTPEPTKTPFPAGVNRLTGEPMDEELAAKRPIAIMVNNIKAALPQSGISEADIVYECNAEGGITRLMCIFQNPTGNRIGSVRSVRHYYASFASEYDAIFCCVGGSNAGIEKLDELGMDYLNGLKGPGVRLTYRDKKLKAPHNAFTSIDNINECIKNGKFRTEYKGKDDNHWTFYDNDTQLESGNVANKVSVKMSGYTTPYFVFKDGVYYRYQHGGPHIDNVNNKQLSFKNVIVMYVIQNKMDTYGRQDMEIENNSGNGYYITNGKYVPITWTKNEKAGTMQYLDKDGKILNINKGKTCIMVVPNTLVEGTKFE